MKRLQIKILILFLAMITGNLNGMMKAPMPMFRPGINQAPLFYDPTIRAESGQEDPTAKNEAFSSKTVRRPALNAGIIASISSELAQTTESRATPENTRSAQQYQLMLLPDQQARDVIDNETIARHEQLKTQKLNKNSINIIENSNSLPSKTFIDFAQVEADHHQLAQNQLLDLNMQGPAVNYHPQQMHAPFSKYTNSIDVQINSSAPHVPQYLREPIDVAFAMEFIDVNAKGAAGEGTVAGAVVKKFITDTSTGYNIVPIDSIALQNWRVAAPNRLQKMSAGVDALENILKDLNFTLLYDPARAADYQDKFMSAPASEYFAALKENYPHTPERLLLIRLTLFLKENQNKYQQKAIPGTWLGKFWQTYENDPTKPIQTSPTQKHTTILDAAGRRQEISINTAKDWQGNFTHPDPNYGPNILSNPGWNSHPKDTTEQGDASRSSITVYEPTDSQKLFALIDSMEAVHAEYFHEEPVDGSITSIMNIIARATADPVNYGIQVGIPMLKKLLESKSTPGKPVLNPQSKQAIEQFLSEQTGIDLNLNDSKQVANAVTNAAVTYGAQQLGINPQVTFQIKSILDNQSGQILNIIDVARRNPSDPIGKAAPLIDALLKSTDTNGPIFTPATMQTLSEMLKNYGVTADLSDSKAVLLETVNVIAQHGINSLADALKPLTMQQDPNAPKIPSIFDKKTRDAGTNLLRTGNEAVTQQTGINVQAAMQVVNIMGIKLPQLLEIARNNPSMLTEQADLLITDLLETKNSLDGTPIVDKANLQALAEKYGVTTDVTDTKKVIEEAVNNFLKSNGINVALDLNDLKQFKNDVVNLGAQKAAQTLSSVLGVDASTFIDENVLKLKSDLATRPDQAAAIKESFIQQLLESEDTQGRISTNPDYVENLNRMLKEANIDIKLTEQEVTAYDIKKTEKIIADTEKAMDRLVEENDKKAAEIAEVTSSTMTGYFMNKFKNAAKSVRNSPENLKTFVKSFIDSFSDFVGLSKRDRAIIQQESAIIVKNLVDDKNSWFRSKTDSDFNKKWNQWVQDTADRFYKLINKDNPANIQVIQIDKQSTDPLTPQVTLSYNTNQANQDLKSMMVSYKGNSYSVPLTPLNYNPATGDYTITAELKPQQTMFQFVNPLIKNTIRTVMPSVTSVIQDAGLTNTVDAVTNRIMNPSDGTVTIKYNRATNSVTSTVDRIMPDSSHLITTKEYSESEPVPAKSKAGSKSKTSKNKRTKLATPELISTKPVAIKPIPQTSQIIEITPANGDGLAGTMADILSPTIRIVSDPTAAQKLVEKCKADTSYNPTAQDLAEVLKANVTHENVMTQVPSQLATDIQYDKKTNEYIITARMQELQSTFNEIQDDTLKRSVQAISQAIQTKIGSLTLEQYKNLLENLDKRDTDPTISMLITTLKSTVGADTYNKAIAWLISSNPTKIKLVVIKYDPAQRTVITGVAKTMSDNTTTITPRTYSY